MADWRRRDQKPVTAVVKRYFEYEEYEAGIAERKEKGPGRRLPFYDSVRKNINSFDVGGIRKKASILRAIGFESWHGVVNGCVAAFRNRFEADSRECGPRADSRRDNQSSCGFWNRFCSATFPDSRRAKAAVADTEECIFRFQNGRCEGQRNGHCTGRGPANATDDCLAGGAAPDDHRPVNGELYGDIAGRRGVGSRKDSSEAGVSDLKLKFSELRRRDSVRNKRAEEQEDTGKDSSGAYTNCGAVPQCSSEATSGPDPIYDPASWNGSAASGHRGCSSKKCAEENEDTRKDLSEADSSPLLSSSRAVPQYNSEAPRGSDPIYGPASWMDNAEPGHRGCVHNNCAEEKDNTIKHMPGAPGAGTCTSGMLPNNPAGRTVRRRSDDARDDPNRMFGPANATPRTLQKALPEEEASGLRSERVAGRTLPQSYNEARADPNRINGPARTTDRVDERYGCGVPEKRDHQLWCSNSSTARTAPRRYSEANADCKRVTRQVSATEDVEGKDCGGFRNGFCKQSSLQNKSGHVSDSPERGPQIAPCAAGSPVNVPCCEDLRVHEARAPAEPGHCSETRKQYRNCPSAGDNVHVDQKTACRSREGKSECAGIFSGLEMPTTPENYLPRKRPEYPDPNRCGDLQHGADHGRSSVSCSSGRSSTSSSGRSSMSSSGRSSLSSCSGRSSISSSSGKSSARNFFTHDPGEVPKCPDSSEPEQIADPNRYEKSKPNHLIADGPISHSECLSKLQATEHGHSTSLAHTTWTDAPGVSRGEINHGLVLDVPEHPVGNDSLMDPAGRNSGMYGMADGPMNRAVRNCDHAGSAKCPLESNGNVSYKTTDQPQTQTDLTDGGSGSARIAHRPRDDATKEPAGNTSASPANFQQDPASQNVRKSGTADQQIHDGPLDRAVRSSDPSRSAKCPLEPNGNVSYGTTGQPQTQAHINITGSASGSTRIAHRPPDNAAEDPAGKSSERPEIAHRPQAPADPAGRGPVGAAACDAGSESIHSGAAWQKCDHRRCDQYISSLQTILNNLTGLKRSQTTVTRPESKPAAPEPGHPPSDVVPDFQVRPRRSQKKARLPDGKVAVGLGVVLLPPCPVHLAQIIRWKAESKKEEGNEAYKRKEYREALQLYSEAIELCPEYAAYYGNRCACLMMLGRYDAALADAKQSTRLDETFVKGHLREAKCNLALGDLAAAKTSLQKVEILEPTNSSLKEELNHIRCVEHFMVEALKSYEKKDYRQAVYYLDRALANACACTRFQLQKAECLVFLNRYQEAQDITSDLIRGDGTNADAIYIRGLCLYYQDNIEKAFTHFQQVLRYAPDHTKAREAYKRARALKQKKEEGNAAFRSGNLQQAYDIYNEALLIDSNNVFTNAKLYFNRAVVSHKLKKLNQAVEDCTQAIKLDETYVKAYIKRGRCYQELEMFEESVRDFEKANKLDGTQENHSLLQEAKLELKKSKRKDYYKILGIGRTASEEEIKKAYRKRALVHHPDRHANAPDDIKKEQEKKFKELGEAYSILSDPKKKSRYDCGQDFESSGDYDPYNIFQTFYTEPTARHYEFTNGRFPGGGGFPGGFTFQFG